MFCLPQFINFLQNIWFMFWAQYKYSYNLFWKWKLPQIITVYLLQFIFSKIIFPQIISKVYGWIRAMGGPNWKVNINHVATEMGTAVCWRPYTWYMCAFGSTRGMFLITKNYGKRFWNLIINFSFRFYTD